MTLETVENRYLEGRRVLNCSDQTATEIDNEVRELLKECYNKAKELIQSNKDALDRIAEYLFEKETITGKEFMELFNEGKEIAVD
jgi:cell division protease FtsH